MILNGKPGSERRMLGFSPWGISLSPLLREIDSQSCTFNSRLPGKFRFTNEEEGLIETSINHRTIYNMKMKGLCCDGKLLAKLTMVEWDKHVHGKTKRKNMSLTEQRKVTSQLALLFYPHLRRTLLLLQEPLRNQCVNWTHSVWTEIIVMIKDYL